MTDKPFDPPGPNFIWRAVWGKVKKKIDALLGVKPKEPPKQEKEIIGPKQEFKKRDFTARR